MPRRELVARTLCRASANGDVCNFCKEYRGVCQTTMWQTFLKEADAVLAVLEPRRPLPGLGG